MVGTLIGAGLSALSAAGNWYHSKKVNDELKDTLDADAAGLRSDIVTAKYGDPKYSGANYVLNDVAEKLRERSQARQAAGKVVRSTVGAQAAGDQQDAETLKSATAQTYAQGKQAGMQEAAQARQALSQNRQTAASLKANQSAQMTKALSTVANIGGQIASMDINSTYPKESVVNTTPKNNDAGVADAGTTPVNVPPGEADDTGFNNINKQYNPYQSIYDNEWSV